MESKESRIERWHPQRLEDQSLGVDEQGMTVYHCQAWVAFERTDRILDDIGPKYASSEFSHPMISPVLRANALFSA